MTKNIFIELELFLDPPINDAAAIKDYLEEKILFWQNNDNISPQYKIFVAKARKYIADGFPSLEQQGKKAHAEKFAELEEQAKTIKISGITERKVKNLVNDFKKFFHEDTIKKLVQLEDFSSIQSDDEFVVPVCPASLKCDSPVPFMDMRNIAFDLNVATDGKCDSLYKLLKVNEKEETADIFTKATVMSKEIRDMPKTNIKADPLNRLSAKFMLYFKDDIERKKYDVAIRRCCFDQYAATTLKHYVEGWVEKNKTDWNQYCGCIDEVKKLKHTQNVTYTQEEAAWLVYEYFCITRKCPLPKKPKTGSGWGQFAPLRSQLLSLFKESIEVHRSNPKIKNKLQSVLEQFNRIDDPDSVKSTVKQIIEVDLRKFWDSCKRDGSITIPLFQPAKLANYSRACLHYIFGEMGYFQGFFKDGGGTISSICPNRSRWYSTDPWK